MFSRAQLFVNPMDCVEYSRILEWVAFLFSRGSSQPRDQTQVSHICGQILYQLSHNGSPRKWSKFQVKNFSTLIAEKYMY